MSREIDMSDPSSWDTDDVLYLRDRGRLPEDYEAPEEEIDFSEEGLMKLSLTQLKALASEYEIEGAEDFKKKKDAVEALLALTDDQDDN